MRIIFLLPLIFSIVGLSFSYKLLDQKHEDNSSSLIWLDQELANYRFTDISNNETIDVKELEYPALINIFSSWCVACKQEHETLMRLAQYNNVKLYGIIWKDAKSNIINYLKELGNPYHKTLIVDDNFFADLAIAGVPETILIDKNKKIIFKYIGPLDQEFINVIEKTYD